MKFTNGIWFDREGASIYNAVETDDVTHPRPNHIRALCTTRHISSRGDTLNKPTITVQLSSPSPGIIAGSAYHFRGVVPKLPRFELFPEPEKGPSSLQTGDITHDPESNTVSLSSGSVRAVLNKNPNSLSISYRSKENDAELTDLGMSCIQYIINPPNAVPSYPPIASTTIADPYYRGPPITSRRPHMAVSFGLQVGELVYGLGERFGPFAKNGQHIELWNEDAGTASPYAYKNVPFYLTNRGYGVFFDHSDGLSVEIQNEKLAKVQVSVQGEEVRWYIIYGPTPKEILAKYAKLTGRSPLPPAWSFGLYLSTSFLTDYDEKTVTSQLDGMVERGIPMSVLHFDCFWMKAHQWTNFTFDPKYFPDAKAFLNRIHKRGLKVCVWINSYIAQDSDAFEEAMAGGYLIKRTNGDVWQSDIWQAGMGIVDFTNPAAVTWYKDHLKLLLDQGVDSFKTDFGERIPWEDVVYHNGMDPAPGHNYYSHLYNKTVYDAISEVCGVDQALLFARSATAGGQQFPVHWGGDCESTWQGMAQSLRGGLSLGLSGFGYWSHDIAGFMSEGQALAGPASALYKRWVQFGLLSSHSRLHGSKSYRVPWTVDDEASAVLRKFCQLKNLLMPYVYRQAMDSHQHGLPLLRAMLIEYPDDKVCQGLDQQYMFGNSLLVAPVFSESGIVDFYVPTGKWVGLLDGQSFTGPAWFTRKYDYFHLPVLLRENKVLLVGKPDKPDYDWAENITRVLVGAVTETALEVDVPSFSKPGETVEKIRISRDDGGQPFILEGGLTRLTIETLSEECHM
ncbi:hypothetical protein V495_01717 [Pseudogymnoascus sp. VKM F-4514 (FW-929)]|nr:hypothetical protein V495_01717 [Pseudogymnoascus sp. VKM F-4514 (FW-929)]KFY63656.1 hypothetical protein V497_01941 [Pseudogymnoascus sp. VKM F-4516 (FW-969)]